MIKLRLHGTAEEITKFKDFMSGLAGVRVLQCSEQYADRGNSVYKRMYMDVELHTPCTADNNHKE